MLIRLTSLLMALLTMAALPQGMSDGGPTRPYDLILTGGIVFDGSGAPGQRVDVAVRGDQIAAVGDLDPAQASRVLSVEGLAVAPGFINMLSWASSSLLVDGRGLSDLQQGVTLEVFGEGWSMGPLNERMRRDMLANQGDLKFDVPWTTLMEYLEHLVAQGVSPNVASFVGATTVRIHELGYEDRPPTAAELARMQDLVRREMEQGALGIGSSLIYAPAFYADTRELTELCRVASEYGGMYISHLRSEGNRLEEAVHELIQIAREAGLPAQIYHLKAAGEENWGKLQAVIERIEQERAKGLKLTADIYPYTAGATGLNASMPPWVQEGGLNRWRDRLRDPQLRQRVAVEMKAETDEWENLLLMAGSAERVLLVGFKNPDLKHLTGKSLAEVARQRGKSPEETAMDLVIQDGSRVECVYFLMSDDNLRKKVALPWVSFCSDAAALAPVEPFSLSNPHPRSYGSFARVLGKFVRDEQVISLAQAIHKLTELPAQTLGISKRGSLEPGCFADLVVFDPESIQDHATYDQPHQLASGVRHVWVNGRQVIENGMHTGATPGRVVRRSRRANREPVTLTEEGREVHRAGFVFDGHNDLPWAMRSVASSSFERKDISKPQPDLHTDIPRLRKGNVGAQFWSVYVPADTAQTGVALSTTLEQIEFVKAMCQRYPEVFELALNTEDIERIRQQGKIASMIGMEGGHSIEDSLQNLRRLYDLGARYMTLTHSDTLSWADSATDTAKHGGLSPFGEEVVREMNRLGMLVDLSHVSPETMKDALRVTQAPVIFSHSSARAIAEHPRNVPDDVLKLTAKNGGVVMVNFFSGFIEPTSAQRMASMFDVIRDFKQRYPNEDEYRSEMAKWRTKNPMLPGDLHTLVDHIEHIAKVAGVDHVGLGSDYDGVSMLPKQLEDVSTYPLITQELLNRGFQPSDVHKIMSGNVMRVLREAERVARELKSQ